MNITDIYEDSPNGYLITTDQPPNVDDAIKYYLATLEIYPPTIYPLEFAMVNYGMGCLLFGDKSKPLFSVERAKRVENALYHFNHAMDIFNYKDYPVMFGLISIFMSHLFLERSSLINPRSFLAKRSTPEESVQYGLDTILEVFPIVYHSNKHVLEHAMCCYVTGWLYVCQSEYLDNIQNNSIREQAITYLERCIRIIKQVRGMTNLGSTVLVLHNHNREDKKHKVTKAGSYLEYNPQMVTTFPKHIKLLSKGYNLAYIEGTAYYLLGRLHQGWLIIQVRNHVDEGNEDDDEPFYTRNLLTTNDQYDGSLNRNHQKLSEDDPNNMDTEIYNYRQAFEYLSLSIKPKYLTNDCLQWADAHHRLASVIIKYPVIVDPDFVAPPPNGGKSTVKNSDLYLEVAISHLVLALRSPLIAPPVQMDINFHIAQCYITKLQLVIDSTPIGQSVTKNIIATDSLDVIQSIETHLKDAVKRVTAASTQTTQEGYLYYFSCMKVAEYRMLEAACRPELSSDDRNFYLKDSVEYLVDALMSRPLVDNVDLHYVASSQMSAMLMSCKKTFAACKSLCKTLLVLCVMLNRSLFNPETAAQLKLSDEMVRQTTQAMLASSKDIFWVKKHFGAFYLNERLQAGYAVWSFEDAPSVKIDESKMIHDFSAHSPAAFRGGGGTVASEELHIVNTGIASGQSSLTKSIPVNRAAPPAGVPPLKLPPLSTKKMTTVGGKKIVPLAEDGGNNDGTAGYGDDELDVIANKEVGIKPRPPNTGIPLSALGHNPDFTHATPHQLQHTVSGMTTDGPEEQEESFLYPGPYGRRMRKRVPLLKDMIDIDRKVKAQFGFNKNKAVFLIPAYTTVDNESSSMAFSKKKLEIDHDHRDNQIKNPEGNFSNVGRVTEGGSKSAHKSQIIDSEIEIYNAHKDDDENEFDGDDENEDELTDEDGDFDFANVKMKKASSKYHASNNVRHKDNNSKGSKTKKQQTSEEAAALSLRKLVRPGQIKEETVMGWLFKSIVNSTKRVPQPKRAEYDQVGYYTSDTSKSFLNPFQNKTVVDKTGKDAEPEDTIHMWCSTQCFCAFMLLSRMSRMQLVMRSRQFHLLDSERTNYILYHLRQSYVNTLLKLKEQLYEDCAKLIIPPTTLKDVSARSFLELQILFKSNMKLCKKLDEWEQLIYYKISKYDYFIPMIAVLPVFLRDISNFDSTLLNPNKLIVNLTYEERLEQLIAKNEQYNAKRNADKDDKVKRQNAGSDNFSYDSASLATTSVATKDKDGKSINPLILEQQRLRAEEKEEVLSGKMSLPLSQAMDGSNYLKSGQQGVRDMLTSYLAQDECMMTWHLPHHANHNIQVVLAWRDNSASTHTYYSSAEAMSHSILYEQTKGDKGAIKHKKDPYKKKKKTKSDANTKKNDPGEKQLNKGIILEIAKSDLDTGRMMQLIANYIQALHSNSPPQRITMVTDALRSLSCALSLTEFLNMIPPHVRSLVICCPAVMRVIPWHLILIEMSSDYGTGQLNSSDSKKFGSKPVEIHLMEKFCVRLGPSLSIFELVNTAAKYHKHSVGLHRLCAIDGEGEVERLPGIRGSDVEVACVSQIWSLDPLDYHILMNDAAAPRNIQTGLFADGSNASYRKFKKSIYVSRHESVNPIKVNKLKKQVIEEEEGAKHHKHKKDKLAKLKNEAGDIPAEKLFGAMDETTHVKVSSSPNKNKYRKLNPDGTAKHAEAVDDEEEEKSNGSSSEYNSQSDDDLEEAQKESEFHMRSLSLCRVLHITSTKVPQQLIKENIGEGPEDSTCFEAAISLPKYEKIMTVNNKRVKLTDPRTYLTTSDLIRQVYVQNNALTMFSKFGLTDDITNVYSNEIEINTSFIEAAHLAGANTVVHPLWSCSSMGHGLTTLAHLIFQVRFYSILPSKSRDRVSITETVRKTQLWLKDASADAIIAFIFKASIPPKAKQLIIDELEALVKASLSSEDVKHKNDMMSVSAPSKVPVSGSIASVGQETLQSPFMAPGDGVTAGNRIGGDKKFFDHFLLWGSYVVSGHGGGVHHPDLTEVDEDGFDKGIIAWDDKELNNLTLEARMLRLEGKFEEAAELEKYIRQIRAKMVTDRLKAIKLAGQKAGRGFLDGLDYLDKKYLDQDSDSIVLSSDESSDDPDSDDEDINDEVEEQGRQLAADDPLNPNYNNNNKRRQFVPKPLELDNLKPDNLIYSQWKSKVTSLNLEVKAPVVNAQRLVTKKQETIVKQNNDENYELNMKNKATANIDGAPQLTEAMIAAKAARKAKLDKRYAGMSPEQISMAKARRKVEKQAKRGAKEKKAAAADDDDDDSDDDSDDSWERERELQEQRKRERQTKFKQTVAEIRGDVRSYSQVVNDITSGNMMKNDNGEGCIVS